VCVVNLRQWHAHRARNSLNQFGRGSRPHDRCAWDIEFVLLLSCREHAYILTHARRVPTPPPTRFASTAQYGEIMCGQWQKPTALRTTYRVENSVGSGSGVRNERVISHMIYKHTILTMRKCIPVYKITCWNVNHGKWWYLH